MTFGKTLLGAAAAIGLFAGATGSASALSINLVPGDIQFKFTGYTTENMGTIGSDAMGGSSVVNPLDPTGPRVYNETTWGAGYVTSIIKAGGGPGSTLWFDTKNDESLSYFIYGIADYAIEANGIGGFNIYNIGCTNTTQFAGCDGKIHIDFYQDTYLPGGTNPSFTDTSAAGAQTSDRTGFSTFTGITDGSLLMAWELEATVLIPGTVTPDKLITQLFQIASQTSLPATGSGNFFAECVGGSLCPTLNTESFTTPLGTTVDLSGGFNLRDVTADPALQGAEDNKWLGNIEDPVRAVIPEPTTLSLLGMGLLGLGAVARRRRQQA